jgi:hypothetical protein
MFLIEAQETRQNASFYETSQEKRKLKSRTVEVVGRITCVLASLRTGEPQCNAAALKKWAA